MVPDAMTDLSRNGGCAITPISRRTGRTEDSGNQYIANMRDGAVAGFKYFAFKDAAEIKVHCTGSANGRLQVSTAPDFSTLCADIFIKTAVRWGKGVPYDP